MAKKRKARRKLSRWHAAPLKSTFMLASILGLLISAYYVYPQSEDYGLAFLVVFGVMFAASVVSMTQAPVAE